MLCFRWPIELRFSCMARLSRLMFQTRYEQTNVSKQHIWARAPMRLLEVRNLHAHYGKSHILAGVSMWVADKEIVAVLGRNGSGRSTLLKALMGLVPPSSGSIN